MAFNRYINDIDQCKAPVCPDDIKVEITNISCAYSVVSVEWVIIYGNIYVNPDDNYNILQYSFDDPTFDLLTTSNNSSNPYQVNVVFSTESLFYARVKVRVNGDFYVSNIQQENLSSCGV